MMFTSMEFLVFALVFYNFYLHLGRWRRAQNAWLLLGSYIFYGWWDWRFLSLLAFSTVLDYTVGRRMAVTDDPKRRKHLLWLSLAGNLGVLGFFKYFNFFVGSAVDAAGAIGVTLDPITLGIVLPVGISFYTFQTLSYSIDLYRREVEPADSILDFAVYVSFFPQLVAGPIERAKTFLPQVQKPRQIDAGQFEAGVFLICWGFFKKLVIADNVALVANTVFNNHHSYQGVDLLLGALAFTVQIYCDFSAYSDIARGLAKLMGFELMVNFKLPYFARTPSEFWRRWHVSLSTWLRDYLYIPLGGNRGGTVAMYRNLCITMLLGGLWHGAAWNFVLWGAFHGAILVAYRPFEGRFAPATNPVSAGARVFGAWAIFFSLTVVGWVLFRASSAEQIGWFFTQVWSGTSAKSGDFAMTLLYCSVPLALMQVVQYVRHDLLIAAKGPVVVRGGLYAVMVGSMLLFGAREPIEFIYFQF